MQVGWAGLTWGHLGCRITELISPGNPGVTSLWSEASLRGGLVWLQGSQVGPLTLPLCT